MVILVDEEDRENEGDLVIAADFVTPDAVNFMAKHGRGLVCLTLTEARCRQLNLAPMVIENRTVHGTAFTSLDRGRRWCDYRHFGRGPRPHCRPQSHRMPSHRTSCSPATFFRSWPSQGGVLARAGHTEAGCDLTRPCRPDAGGGDLRNPQGRRVDGAAAGPCGIRTRPWSQDRRDHRSDPLPQPDRAPDRTRRRTADPDGGRRISTRDVPRQADRRHALWRWSAARSRRIAMCWCACTSPFPSSICSITAAARIRGPFPRRSRLLATAERGILVLLHRPESALELRQRAVSDQTRPDIKVDLRNYGIGAQILRDLDVGRMRLLARPRKMPSMAGFGLEVTGHLEPPPEHRSPR